MYFHTQVHAQCSRTGFLSLFPAEGSCAGFMKFMCMIYDLVGASGALVYLPGLCNGFMCIVHVNALTAC